MRSGVKTTVFFMLSLLVIVSLNHLAPVTHRRHGPCRGAMRACCALQLLRLLTLVHLIIRPAVAFHVLFVFSS